MFIQDILYESLLRCASMLHFWEEYIYCSRKLGQFSNFLADGWLNFLPQ